MHHSTDSLSIGGSVFGTFTFASLGTGLAAAGLNLASAAAFVGSLGMLLSGVASVMREIRSWRHAPTAQVPPQPAGPAGR